MNDTTTVTVASTLPGWPAATPEPHFDDWDATPHGHFIIPVEQVKLGDIVLGGTHQVEGLGRADQRGTPALRLDLNFLVGPSVQSSARIVVPVDHRLEVKRYDSMTLTRGHGWAYVNLDEQVASVPAGLVPDYGPRTNMCCALVEGTNPHGYEAGQTLCDDCADSWAIDHRVVRHLRPRV